MNDKQKLEYLVQALKNTMATINDLEETQDAARQAGTYELNIIATLLHDAEIISTKDYLHLVRLYPIDDPFSKLSKINNIAVGFIESGPYSEGEPQVVIDTMWKIEKLSTLD